MLTHGNLAPTPHAGRAWGFSADDVLLHALPVFHVHGLFVASHCALLAGARMLLLAHFDAATVLALLPQLDGVDGRADLLHAAARGAVDRETARTMRLFVSGSAPLLPSTFEEFEAAPASASSSATACPRRA